MVGVSEQICGSIPQKTSVTWTGAPRSPRFPVELVGVGEPHADFLTESRTSSHGWSHIQEIWVAPAYVGRKWFFRMLSAEG
jgi:hypothetical protein